MAIYTIYRYSCQNKTKYVVGSIVVSFELVTSSGSDTLGEMAYTLETAFAAGTLTFTAPDGTVLTVQAGSFSYIEVDTDSKDDDDDEGWFMLVFVYVFVFCLCLTFFLPTL